VPIASYGPRAKITPLPGPGRVRKSLVLIGLKGVLKLEVSESYHGDNWLVATKCSLVFSSLITKSYAFCYVLML